MKYSITTKKNRVRLTFESPLLDNTTYTFNFLQGITDLTEKNPVVNLSLALSTGLFIDSLIITGNVRELYKQQPTKNVLVGLYPYSDSLNLGSYSRKFDIPGYIDEKLDCKNSFESQENIEFE